MEPLALPVDAECRIKRGEEGRREMRQDCPHLYVTERLPRSEAQFAREVKPHELRNRRHHSGAV